MDLDITKSNTKSTDGRPSLSTLYAVWSSTIPSDWTIKQLATQSLLLLSGKAVQLPILAFCNDTSLAGIDTVFIGGIHGREPAGAISLAHEAQSIIEYASRHKVLVMPLMNPWGYYNHVRYGTAGGSVTDCDHLLGRLGKPACPECENVGRFIAGEVMFRPGAKVLDLHEDPGYEEGAAKHKSTGTYMYTIGKSCRDAPAATKIKQFLRTCALPLIQSGTTRFGERIVDGVVEDSHDGSIDEFLSTLGASPVITLETLLMGETEPALEERVRLYRDVIHVFMQE